MNFKLLILLLFPLMVFSQENTQIIRVPKPYLPPVSAPVEVKNEAPPGNNGSNPTISVIGGDKTYNNLGLSQGNLSPEISMINALQDLPVNQYTGTPSINLPITSISEGRLSLPIYLTYNPSANKPHSVASYTGLGWDLGGIPTLSRMVRGLPDEGSLNNNIGQTGYFRHGTPTFLSGLISSGSGHFDKDKQSDIYFLNTPSGSFKFVFDNYGNAVFLPENDIKVEINYIFNPNEIVTTHYAHIFSSFIFTFPDGTKYFFTSANVEETGEVEVKKSRTDQIYPLGNNFLNFIKNNLNINAWYCTKIQSPYNEEINFTYDKVAYTYYKLAENKSDKDNYYGICNSVINKINKVYVRSSQISTITTRNSKISFNPENKLCYLDYSFNPPQEVCVNASIPRYDIDSWGNWPTNSSEAKILKTIVVSDNEASPTQTIKYQFNYDYFTGTDHALPTNYTYAEVGTTHQKKLILKTIVMPDNSITTLNYQNETASQLTRFTYGVDHWGYYNGIQTNIQPYGFLGADNYFQSCRSNRTQNFSVATSRLLNNLSTSTGFNLNLVYEAHNASNYGNIPIGGFRIKEVQSTDPIRNLSIKKTYNYTLANNASSGFLFVSPTYTVYSPGFLYGHSDLFASLIAESQRPIVGYSRVEELITSVPVSPSNGKTIYYFDVDDTPAKILQNQGCYILNIPCVENPIYFNLQHDYRGGNLLKQEIYNANNALIGKEEYAYSPNGPSSTNSFYAIKQFTQSDLGTNNYSSQALAYYEAIKRLRLVSKTSTQYNRTGVGSGVSSTINYFYKEDMPLAYRNTYPGVHNQVVKTTQSDEENNTSESLIKYASDFDFGRDTTEYMVMECDIYGNNCVDVPHYEISIHVPNSTTEASAIFELKSKNMLYAPVESIQKLNNWTLAANYQSYFPANSSFKTLPHKNYVIRQSPLASFTDATFQLSNDAMIKDSRYGFEISEMLSYNPLGQALQGRAKYGSTVGIVYDPTNVLPISQTSNVGKSEALTSHIAYAKKFQGISQKTMPNGLYNTLEYENLTARQKNIKDKDGNILSQYSYNTVPTTQNTSNISWLNTDRTKLCSGSQITMKVFVTGLISGATAQFSTNGGTTWTNANIGNNGFSYTISPTDTYQTFMARASDNPSETISTQYHASCNTLANLSWGPYSVATQQVSPLVCQYNISVNGLKPDSYAEFSIDNNSWIRGNISDSQMRFLLLSTVGVNQNFWFRPADNPSQALWGVLNSCTP